MNRVIQPIEWASYWMTKGVRYFAVKEAGINAV